jgi:hypothetical protein
MDFLSKKYAPMNQAHIHGFPNQLPCIDWQAYLPKFKEEKGEDVAIHLIMFHVHMHKLRVHFPEDFLMKMFMETLEEKEILQYEGFPTTILYSLKDFYLAFYEYYKENHPSIELAENFCGNFESLFQHLGIDMDDEDLMNDEIKESLLEFKCQSSCSSDVSFSKSWLQKENIQEVVFLDTLEEQDYIEDQLVREKDVVPFSLTDNRVELFNPPRYDEYDDDFLEQPILCTSSRSDPIYDAYTSQS